MIIKHALNPSLNLICFKMIYSKKTSSFNATFKLQWIRNVTGELHTHRLSCKCAWLLFDIENRDSSNLYFPFQICCKSTEGFNTSMWVGSAHRTLDIYCSGIASGSTISCIIYSDAIQFWILLCDQPDAYRL